jgi:hypothetical protein
LLPGKTERRRVVIDTGLFHGQPEVYAGEHLLFSYDFSIIAFIPYIRRVPMRSSFLVLGICIALGAMFLGNAHAVGIYAVGKEKCRCAGLTAQGKIPDTLNRLAEIPVFGLFSAVVDRVAGEVKAILNQWGMRTTHVWAKRTTPTPRPRTVRKKKKRRVKLPRTVK